MSVPNGASIFPLALITQPQPAEFLQDSLNQILEIAAQQCAPASGAALTGATITLASSQTGTFTANGATAVTVANAAITANSQVLITLKTVGGTVGAIPHLATITPGTGFTVVGTASDTSVYNYAIIG